MACAHDRQDMAALLKASLSMPTDTTTCRDGEVTFENELSYNCSYFQVRNLETLVTSVTVTTIKS